MNNVTQARPNRCEGITRWAGDGLSRCEHNGRYIVDGHRFCYWHQPRPGEPNNDDARTPAGMSEPREADMLRRLIDDLSPRAYSQLMAMHPDIADWWNEGAVVTRALTPPAAVREPAPPFHSAQPSSEEKK